MRVFVYIQSCVGVVRGGIGVGVGRGGEGPASVSGPWCVIGYNEAGWGGVGVGLLDWGCQRIAPGSCAVLCWALCCSIYLLLCVSRPASPCLLSSARLCICARAPLAPSGSDDSSGIGMKVTQGNKGPLFPTVVGVESGTQEFQAPAPGSWTPKGPGMLPLVLALL